MEFGSAWPSILLTRLRSIIKPRVENELILTNVQDIFEIIALNLNGPKTGKSKGHFIMM